jgi:hypothetical protein
MLGFKHLSTKSKLQIMIEVCEDLSQDFGLHLFNFAKPERDLQE